MRRFTLLTTLVAMFAWQGLAQVTCDYTFNMFDSYGDGWNGAVVSFEQNGAVISTHTLATGSSGTASVTLEDGVDVNVLLDTPGSYDSEITFDFLDPNGTALITAGTTTGLPATFTAACPGTGPPCDYTFEMIDSYGDGWNGWSFAFVQNGTAVSVQTLPSGAYATALVTLDDVTSTDIVINNAGSYGSEVSFNIIDPFGSVVGSLSGATGATGDIVFTFTTNCTPPACADPSALTASNVTSTSVDIGWTENGTATSWNVEYGAAGFALGSGSLTTGTTYNPETVTGLSASTAYEF